MPTTSVISAVIDKFGNLGPSGFPNAHLPGLYLDVAPQVSEGSQVFVPYVILRDEGTVPSYEFERSSRELTTLAFEVYYPTLGEVDQAVAAIKWNGGRPQDALGFDFGSLPALTSPRSELSIRRVQERRSFAGYSKNGGRVHMATITYQILIEEAAGWL